MIGERVLLVAMVLMTFTGGEASGQKPVVAYSAKQLNCARFLETGESRILTESGGRTRNQSSTRRGLWQFRSVPSNQNLALEGWLDSLTITRRSEETAISPDTDGLLGGRYRGTLSRLGRYVPQVHPFVPDEVAEVAGMERALDDLFPPLAGRTLVTGEVWTDSAGLSIRRLQDSTGSGVTLLRFELQKRGEAYAAPTAGDTLPIKLEQESEERGSFVWHPVIGLVRRDRTIVIETTVPPSRRVRQAVRSRVEQKITLIRDLTKGGCHGVGAG